MKKKFYLLLFLFPFLCSLLLYLQKSWAKNPLPLKEALFYEKLKGRMVHCLLCPRNCLISEGGLGDCRARKNIKGKLYALGYGVPCAVHPDPIEKKPLFHVLPATISFSIASAGCNLRCKFCQNWQISQSSPEETKNFSLPPESVVKTALKNKYATIAYTYAEPVSFYEYMLDTAKLAHEKGIKNVMHSAGYINEEPLRELCKYLDAANIDLKSFREKYYRKICGGSLQPVLRSLKVLKEEGVWLEVTNLVLPGLNDSPEEIRELCLWVRDNLGKDTPLHFSRFYPTYQMKNLPPTPTKTLERAREIALEAGLHYVYIGNIPGHRGENTYCPSCKKTLIRRIGYEVLENNIVNGKCKFCGTKIAGLW